MLDIVGYCDHFFWFSGRVYNLCKRFKIQHQWMQIKASMSTLQDSYKSHILSSCDSYILKSIKIIKTAFVSIRDVIFQ